MPRLLARLFPLLAALTLVACGGDTDAPDPVAPAAEAPARPAPTDAPADAGVDEAALAAYTLDMDKVERWQRAAENLEQLTAENPGLQESWDAEAADAESFDDMLAQIGREPEVRRAIESAGLSLRDYVLTNLALLQAMVAQSALEMNPGSPAPEGVNPENVAFVRENRARLEAMLESAGMEE